MRAWRPSVALDPKAAFSIVLCEQPLAADTEAPAHAGAAVCAPDRAVRLPPTVAEAAASYATADAAEAPPVRLSRSALKAYARGELLAIASPAVELAELFGDDAAAPRLGLLARELIAAKQRNADCWREIDRMLSWPKPPAASVRQERLMGRLRSALERLHTAPNASCAPAIDRLRAIAGGAPPAGASQSAAALAEDVALLRCLAEQPEAATELATLRVYLEAARPGPQLRKLLIDRATTLEQLSFAVLLSEPHRLPAMRATFDLYLHDYSAAYREHHGRYWRATERLRATLDEAAPTATALARLNTLLALGRPVGEAALAAYERLTSDDGACRVDDLSDSLRDHPRCSGCGITMEAAAPSEEVEEVLGRLRKALALQQSRLSSEAVRRILARGGERVEQFLSIAQAADLTGLAQILDEKLLAFLGELLAEPVSPAPAALDLLHELVRAYPTVSEEQVEAVTETLRQLLLEMLESQQLDDPSRQAAIQLAAALPEPRP